MGFPVLARSRRLGQPLFLDPLGFLGLFPTSIHHLDVIVEDGRDHWHHVRFHHPRPHILRASHPDVDDALKCQIPLPHVHHILTPPGLEQADQPLDAAIDRQDVSNSRRGCGEIGEVVEGIDQGERRRAIECSAVIQRRGDAHGCFVDVWNAKVDFSQGVDGPQGRGNQGGRLDPSTVANFSRRPIYRESERGRCGSLAGSRYLRG